MTSSHRLRPHTPADVLRELLSRFSPNAAGQPPAVSSEVLAGCLRPLVARAVRTGSGPAALVGWVRQQLAHDPPAAVGELTARLVQWFLPPADPFKQTIREE